MTQLSAKEIYGLAREAGFNQVQAILATAIAFAESGGRTDAIGDVALQTATWGPSVGLWQIRSVNSQRGTGGTRDATRLTDPKFNAHSAYVISGSGTNFNPWTTYKTGAFKQYLDPASQAAGFKPIGGVVGKIEDGTQAVVGAGAGAVKGVVKGAMSVGDFLTKLTDPHFWVRVVQVVGGLGAIVLGALLLKGDLTADALGAVTGAGKGAAMGGLATKAAAAAL